MFQPNLGATQRFFQIPFVTEKRIAPSTTNLVGTNSAVVSAIYTTYFVGNSAAGLASGTTASVTSWDASAEL